MGEGDVPDVVIRPLRQANCLVEMVKHSFQLDIEDPKGLSRHFEGVAKLCESVPGFHLDYPRRYDGLQTVRQAIVAHAMGEELA